MVPGGAPIFAQAKKDKVRIKLPVDLTARNEITIKDSETIPNPRMILNPLGRIRYRRYIDLSDAYFQTTAEPKDVKNCFKSRFRYFGSKVLSRGDRKPPRTFMEIISDEFTEYLEQYM